ncbi:MAG: hypothetical protein R2911_27410 [Caldilineaceae bacterium]
MPAIAAAAYAHNEYNGAPHGASSAVFEDVIARLTYHGLVFSLSHKQYGGGTKYKMQFHPAETLFVPGAVRRWLPDPEPLPIGIADWEPARRQSADPCPICAISICIGTLCGATALNLSAVALWANGCSRRSTSCC